MARGTYSGGGELSFAWNGRKLLGDLDSGIFAALNAVAKEAEQVWRAHWTVGEHPFMTGDERDAGFFLVEPNQQGTATLVIGSDSEHALPHELGFVNTKTGAHFDGHPVIRQTADAVAPTIAPRLRRAMRDRGY